MEPHLRYARASDGVTIAYVTHGEGPPLVWLPPVPFSNVVAQWRIPILRQAYERLGTRIRLILYDGRGTGHSQREVDDVGLDAMSLDLDAVVAKERLSRFALFGFYHSCLLGIAYAARHPKRVTRLVLFGGAARGWDAMAPAETQALLTLIERDWDLFTDAAAHAWLGWSAGETGRLMADAFRTATNPATARTMLQVAQETDVSPDLSRVVAPTLVLHRQGDRQIPLEISSELAGQLPNASLRRLPGSAATLFVEDLEGDVRVLTDFLTDGGGSDPTTAAESRRSAASSSAKPKAGLTPREVEVLRLVAGGETNAEVARRLGVSVHTVERHLANLYPKIGARGRADATAFAVRQGIV